jgi:hypothetical protein
VVEIVIGDRYLPLVYVSSGNPDDVPGTCARGGEAVAQLEPNWHVCRRAP